MGEVREAAWRSWYWQFCRKALDQEVRCRNVVVETVAVVGGQLLRCHLDFSPDIEHGRIRAMAAISVRCSAVSADDLEPPGKPSSGGKVAGGISTIGSQKQPYRCRHNRRPGERTDEGGYELRNGHTVWSFGSLRTATGQRHPTRRDERLSLPDSARAATSRDASDAFPDRLALFHECRAPFGVIGAVEAHFAGFADFVVVRVLF